MSLITDLMTRLIEIEFFIKINICYAFNKMRIITKINKNLSIFKTIFEIYKYQILFFKIINKFTTLQNFINDTFKIFEQFRKIYLNNVLIYNDKMKNYKIYIQLILKKFREINI